MTIQIIYAEIFHSVLRKIPGHIVDGWLYDLEASLWFLKFRPRLCILLSFTCRHSIFSDWSFILSFLDFSIPSGCSRNAAAEVSSRRRVSEKILLLSRALRMRAAPSVNIAALCALFVFSGYRIVSLLITSSQGNGCQRMFQLPCNCTHFTCWQDDAQNPSSYASAVREPRTSDVEAEFRKGRGTRDKITNTGWITEKSKGIRKSLLLFHWLF